MWPLELVEWEAKTLTALHGIFIVYRMPCSCHTLCDELPVT